MSRSIELMVSNTTTQGGAAVAVSSWGIYTLEWLNHNSAAMLGICGTIGAAVSVLSLFMNWYFHRRAEKLELRHRQRRSKARG